MAKSIQRVIAVYAAYSAAILLVISDGVPISKCFASDMQMQLAAMSDGEGNNAVSDIQSDLDLKNAVRAELLWNDYVDVTQVGIEVDGGIVTLTGFVPTAAAQQAATRSALQAGATEVRNFLRIGQE